MITEVAHVELRDVVLYLEDVVLLEDGPDVDKAVVEGVVDDDFEALREGLVQSVGRSPVDLELGESEKVQLIKQVQDLLALVFAPLLEESDDLSLQALDLLVPVLELAQKLLLQFLHQCLPLFVVDQLLREDFKDL